jgi:uncharacterized protein (TIGR00730 family)
MNQQPVITVFCASSTLVDDIYFADAEVLAAQLVGNGYAIKYGGGAVGLMGALANKALALGGKVIGVIPEFMVEAEWQHPNVECMMITQTMHQRKAELTSNIDAVVALPGSSGTLEELMEVISMKKLGLFPKPIILVNINGFYDPLIELMQRMASQRFMRKEHLQLFQVVNSSNEVVCALTSVPQWPVDAIQFAAV